MIQPGQQSKWIIAFWISAVLMCISMLWLSPDYGVTNDEPIHQLHGELLLRHYQHGDSIAALSPFDEEGNIIKTFNALEDDKIRGMNFFGGSFDLLANALHSYFPSIGIYDFRHAVNCFIGFLMMLFIALTVRELSDWKWALLALFFAFLSPRLFGHSFNNPKDIPFAMSYIAGIYFILRFIRRMPRVSIPDAIALMLVISVSISIRVSGLLLIPYLGLGYLVYFMPRSRNNFWTILKVQSWSFGALLLIIIGGYLGTAFLWPYMRTDIWAPLKVLSMVANFEVFNAYEVFAGQRYHGNEIPYFYIPYWVGISLPLFAIAGSIAAIPLLFKKWSKKHDIHAVSILFFAVLFPALYIMLQKSNVYNGIRHLLFIFPPLLVISTLGWRYAFAKWGQTALRYTLIALLVFSMAESAVWMWKSHPYQVMYFNSLSGGTDQAFHDYELDYWGMSTKEAIEWIDEQTPDKSKENPIKVKMFYGDRIKMTYYTDSIEGLYFEEGNEDVGWDYEIVFVAASKFNEDLLIHWPPERTVYEVKVNGTPLCAVIKAENKDAKIARLKAEASTLVEFIDLSLMLYLEKDYVSCIQESKKALKHFPNNAILHNNIGASYNLMHMFYSSRPYLERAIALDSSLINAHNNLKHSLKTQTPREVKFLIDASMTAYFTTDYNDCIWYAEQSLQLDPDNAIAYNNICSAYNAMQQYEKAIVACKKALQLDPDMELAKNNLRYSQEKLKAR